MASHLTPGSYGQARPYGFGLFLEFARIERPAVALAFVCLLALRASADTSKEATWAVVSGGNGHTYRVVAKSGLISWDSANAAAIAAGGYLATITSATENDFVFSLINDPTYWMQSANGHGPWISGSQPPGSSEPSGGWTWVTRTGVPTPEDFVFTNWESGEPNNLTATVGGVTYNQDRIAFFHLGTGRAGTWSDEFNLTGSPLNQWTISYVIEFTPRLSLPIRADWPTARFSSLSPIWQARPLTCWPPQT